LEKTQQLSIAKAKLIQLNLDKVLLYVGLYIIYFGFSHLSIQVDEAIIIVRSAVASGVDWVELEEMVNLEKRRKNPIALLIEKLDLTSNQITVALE
jgi:hypothetical protein